MFGKPISEYLHFQAAFLLLLGLVGVLRLGVSLAGASDHTSAFLSMNVIGWIAVVYYGVAAHGRGFTYKQLLPLGFFQIVLQQAICVVGILLAIAGRQNVFAAPEFSVSGQSQWIHLAAHLTVGILVPTLLFWGVAALTLRITKAVSRRPALA
jgi:hypothetical protein